MYQDLTATANKQRVWHTGKRGYIRDDRHPDEHHHVPDMSPSGKHLYFVHDNES